LVIQYADYAVWQRGWLSGAVLERELEYWRGRLRGAPEVLELPVDHARPAVMKHSGAIHTFVLPEDLSRRLRELSQREGATLFMTLLAGYAALLGRLGGQEDISIGIPISNRTRAEVEGLVGFFVNTAVIRTDLTGEPSFRELVGRVREAALGAYLHKDVPLEMVVDAVGPERSLSHTPLFQVMFTLQSAETTGSMVLSGVEVEGMEMTAASGTTKFDLTLGMWETEIGLTGRFEYSTELFEPGTIERMTKQLELLLEGAVAAPAQPLREITILAAEEREQMLTEW
jgi:non-ribosomal peptide synthetase component F